MGTEEDSEHTMKQLLQKNIERQDKVQCRRLLAVD
jgi:hypothetical protein